MKCPYCIKVCIKCGEILVAYNGNFPKNKKCKYGVESECKKCRKEHKKQYYENNKEKIIEHQKQYYKDNEEYYKQYREDNKDKILEYNKQYYENNKDKILEYNKQYYENNKDKILEYQKQYYKDNEEHYKQYYEDNKDKIVEYRKQYYEDNKGKILEQCKQYYEDNKDKILEYNKQYREDNKQYHKQYYEDNKDKIVEYRKQYYKENPEKIFNKNNKRRQLENNQGNGINKEQWYEMMNFFEWRCAYSGEYIGGNSEFRTIDHIIPLNNYGEHEIWNCVPMYKIYNSSKNSKNMLEWYTQQGFYSEERLNKIYEWIEYAKNKYKN